VPRDGTVVKIDKMFGGRPYWRDFVRSDRFAVSERNGILYRERIVDQLVAKVDKAISLGVLSGVIVKGPQGVGKSHSLVNLVLKLQASGNYLVTFVPDCDWWRNASFLLRMICHSFNTTPERILAPDVESGFSGKTWNSSILSSMRSPTNLLRTESIGFLSLIRSTSSFPGKAKVVSANFCFLTT
jgi:hypothetical protein